MVGAGFMNVAETLVPPRTLGCVRVGVGGLGVLVLVMVGGTAVGGIEVCVGGGALVGGSSVEVAASGWGVELGGIAIAVAKIAVTESSTGEISFVGSWRTGMLQPTADRIRINRIADRPIFFMDASSSG
jgi:hypothetical protein